MSLVVITGGNRGIGWELAQLYAADGWNVLLGVRTRPARILPERIEARDLDVGSDASVTAFVAGLVGVPIDLLVNNAGIIGPERQSVTDMDFDAFAEVLNTNTLGPLRVTQALLPILRLGSASKVGILTSRMGSLSYSRSDNLAYRASKAAANKVAQAIATDLASDGIAVAAIHPGWARTDMGGPSADIAPVEGATGVKAVLDRLTLAETGRFWNHDGTQLAW